LQPVPPSPVAARKISFNGLKETIVLPQQAGKLSVSGKFHHHLPCRTTAKVWNKSKMGPYGFKLVSV